MPTLVWTRPAFDDLDAIDRWLTANVRGEIAIDMLSAIRLRAYFLENFPHGGRPIGEGLRVLRVIGTPYLIIYRLAGGTVQLLRIRHEREDWFVEP